MERQCVSPVVYTASEIFKIFKYIQNMSEIMFNLQTYLHIPHILSLDLWRNIPKIWILSLHFKRFYYKGIFYANSVQNAESEASSGSIKLTYPIARRNHNSFSWHIQIQSSHESEHRCLTVTVQMSKNQVPHQIKYKTSQSKKLRKWLKFTILGIIF